MELVFETDGQPVERPERLVMLGQIIIQVLGPLERLIEEDFVQTAVLIQSVSIYLAAKALGELHYLMRDGSPLAKGRRNLDRR